jgi:PAS domain S-box-containing protein
MGTTGEGTEGAVRAVLEKDEAGLMQDRTETSAAASVMATIFDKLDMGVLQVDGSGRVTYANPLARELTRKGEQEIAGSHLREVFPAPVARRIARELERSLSRGDAVSFEAHHPGPEGFWLSFRCVPHGRDGVIFFEDTTGLRQIQADLARTKQELEQRVQERTRHLGRTSRMLEEQKELLLTIIDNIPVMLIFFDTSGAVRLVNRSFERLAGWTLEEARRMNVIAALFPDPAHRKQVWEFMMRSRTGWKDFDLTTRKGKVLPSSWANVFLSDGSQIAIGIDISERIQMEKELLRLASAIDQADEGVAIFSASWRIEYVDLAFETLSGRKKQDLIGRSIGELTDFFPEGSHRDVAALSEKQGRKWTGRIRRKLPSGEGMELDLAVSPVYGENGKLINHVLLARDVTEETRLQQHLLQIQKMEAIGTLAGGIAQNLKNAFTPILIDTEILMQDTQETDPSYPILEEILSATRQGIDLVKNILIFSRRTAPAKEHIDLVPVFHEAMDFLRASFPSTIVLRRQVEIKKARIWADPTRIKQLLINLGSNAGHSMRGKGGVLRVGLSRRILDEDEVAKTYPDMTAGPYVRITVRDAGEGMDEETLGHIFEPFFTTKDRREGRGLGLPVVQGIVREHHGAITVDSEPGKGTTFTVLLPEA